jgi:hypothetical protein
MLPHVYPPREFCISRGLWCSSKRLRETLGDALSREKAAFIILRSMEKVQLSRHPPLMRPARFAE